MRKLFPSKPHCSLQPNSIWVSWPGFGDFIVTKPADLQRQKDGGKLPDDVTDREQARFSKQVHKLRNQNHIHRSTGGIVNLASSISLLLAVFFLGTSMLYELKQNEPQVSACSTAGFLPQTPKPLPQPEDGQQALVSAEQIKHYVQEENTRSLNQIQESAIATTNRQTTNYEFGY